MTSVGPDGVATDAEVLEGCGAPDMEAVDVVAHRALEAARRGGRLVLEDVDPEMAELLRLAGLAERFGGVAQGVEPQG